MKRFLLALAALLMAGCGELKEAPAQKVLPWVESKELVVLVQNGPTTLYVDAEGNYAGLEYDLVTRFAEQQGMKVRFVVTSNHNDVRERLKRGEAHLGVALQKGFEGEGLAFGPAYQSIQPVLVYKSELNEASVWKRLYAGNAVIKTLPQYVQSLNQLKAANPSLNWEVIGDGDSESLIERVARGEIDYAFVESHAAEVAQNYFPNVAIAEQRGATQQLAWAVAADDPELQGRINQFIGKQVTDGSLRILLDRYYGHVNRIGLGDAQVFQDRIDTLLPKYRKWFEEAASKYDMDWRMLAALGYTESHWNPDAVSPYGVRGLMMLTNSTATYLGVDRLDPYQSIMGAARLVNELRDRVGKDVAEPDRTWLALAAYNVGIGHLEDARTLARRQGKNPDSWTDVKTTLPLLRNPEYFSTVKYGYARGAEPVYYVGKLRTFYDILARHEAGPQQAAQPQAADFVVIDNPGNLPLNINSRLRAARPQQQAAL
ncbi:membrane-bound lytic murein transglycosylase MltF [Chitinilyticum piscinae]|uniref:Membrane-bound lytic murein transglycosylase MltF n=1 Tax=Chitinilyticum piscinae TaxID=2866724 RepID=A0A8J7KBN6_9NEIS|nr:membrane-bound lytic murein transglycosylase MltF [Chitinilyticum piscinae]MBE9610414.1 membrane-bound lytic murein transglycosylase MltF [Chitinilyticum piscinae]